MLDAGVFLAGFTLVALAWNMTRMNGMMNEWKRDCCESNDPRSLENTEDWNIECSESIDPVARCVDNGQQADSEKSTRPSHGDERETMDCGERPQYTEHDIAIFKAAKRREHFEGMVPGSLTPAPWRSTFYGRGRPACVRRLSSLSSSGYSMVG